MLVQFFFHLLDCNIKLHKYIWCSNHFIPSIFCVVFPFSRPRTCKKFLFSFFCLTENECMREREFRINARIRASWEGCVSEIINIRVWVEILAVTSMNIKVFSRKKLWNAKTTSLGFSTVKSKKRDKGKLSEPESVWTGNFLVFYFIFLFWIFYPRYRYLPWCLSTWFNKVSLYSFMLNWQ